MEQLSSSSVESENVAELQPIEEAKVYYSIQDILRDFLMKIVIFKMQNFVFNNVAEL